MTTGLTPEAEAELEHDLLVLETFLVMYPDAVPTSEQLRERLRDTPKWDTRQRIYRGSYLSIVLEREGW